MANDGKDLIRQLVDNPEYRIKSAESIPPEFNVPRESSHPMFIQVDFGLGAGCQRRIPAKAGGVAGLPFPLCLPAGARQNLHRRVRVGSGLRYLLGGLDSASYLSLLRQAIVGGQDPENVILMEIDPSHQKTLPDFLLTEKLLGIRTVDITQIKKAGNRLYWEEAGRRVPIKRIYNRAIVDELERKGAELNFDFRDDLDVEWAGHPNWYFRISKFSIPYLKHPSVPKTWFLDQLEQVPEDLENYALKPLYSFAGLGVVIAPRKEDIRSRSGRTQIAVHPAGTAAF